MIGKLEDIDSFNILLLVPKPNALQVYISKCLTSFQEEFIKDLLKRSWNFFVVWLLKHKHSARQYG
jgi:hypothetical protein